MRTNKSSLLFAALITAGYGPAAWAYLDPGSGSILLQVILGGIAGLAVAGKLMWHRIKEILGFSPAEDSDSAEP